jgi:calcineurin-like phosphoesterase family protein
MDEAFRERRTKQGTWGINVGVDWWDYSPVAAETLAQHLDDLRRGRATPVTRWKPDAPSVG